MKLFLIHCGFYDSELSDGIYENHVNLFVAAENFDGAKIKAKALPEFKSRRLHIDGVQEIEAVGGWKIHLNLAPELTGKTIINSQKHRDLAPKNPTTAP